MVTSEILIYKKEQQDEDIVEMGYDLKQRLF